MLVCWRTSVLFLERQERDQRTSFSQASRTTFRRSLERSGAVLSELGLVVPPSGIFGDDGGGRLEAEQEMTTVDVLLEEAKSGLLQLKDGGASNSAIVMVKIELSSIFNAIQSPV